MTCSLTLTARRLQVAAVLSLTAANYTTCFMCIKVVTHSHRCVYPSLCHLEILKHEQVKVAARCTKAVLHAVCADG